MGARRKLRQDHAAAAPQPRPALAAEQAVAVDSPVHAQLAHIEASFSDGPAPYPRALRAAIMVGAPAALWALVIASVGALARAAGA